ncbi:hypothetical protein [Heyndrickxia sporothermodurans]|uniref:hypothetical protein n=1 Tax=Heyndrickxia sporothermodurans TaxID=46224 RepID=UPI000D3B4876|nr:hypothetical protein [Heyndrickxia sporothermodurans]PTY92939.1 hypothetical protein B5V90_02340 [Heyndrickxia sporothermodurans]
MMNEELKQLVEQELRQVRIAARQTSINILSLRLALVDKGVCTQEEMDQYDKTAEQTIDLLMLQERDKMKAMIMEQFGEEAAAEIEKELDKALGK